MTDLAFLFLGFNVIAFYAGLLVGWRAPKPRYLQPHVNIDKLNYAQMRLNDYDKLFEALKAYDRFRLTLRGRIVAYKKHEDESLWDSGTVFIVPREIMKISV